MRRFLTLVSLLCLALPAGISISGCTRNPGANYCNGLGYGPKFLDTASIVLYPPTGGISLAFGQTKQLLPPQPKTCRGVVVAMLTQFTYGTTNNQLVDVAPGGNLCAGTWNRNSGGGIADFTICRPPNPLPATGNLPYASAFVTASGASVVSNPVEVQVHAPVTAITLVGPQQCLSQGQMTQLDAQACYSSTLNPTGQPQNVLLCKPSTVTDASQFACNLPYTTDANGKLVQIAASALPACTPVIGSLSFNVDNPAVATLNNQTNQITAQQPGTTAIEASVTNSGSSAGYFSTCPPASISVKMQNGGIAGTIAQGVEQNLVTSVVDTQGKPISGLSLTYQSTDPIDIGVGAVGAVSTTFPGVASIYAVCQPPACNPAPINQIGLYGTGFSLASNAVTISTPGTSSDYVWFGAPGQSQYIVPFDLQTGTNGSTVRLPYVPNSMVEDKLGQAIYFGTSHGMLTYNIPSNVLSAAPITSAPGKVMAVAPNNSLVLVNDPIRQVFYLYSVVGSYTNTFSGMGASAFWTPDSSTLYITDSAALGNGHNDTLYVFNGGTGWATYPLPSSVGAENTPLVPGAQSLAVTVPSVGAYASGSPTVAHTWCPSGTVNSYDTMSFYPQADEVRDASNDPVQTDVLAATTDGNHILGAALVNGNITLSDIGVTIPTSPCPETTTGTPPVETLDPLLIAHTLSQAQLSGLAATAVNQILASPASNLAFITYTAPATNTNAVLPYYQPQVGNTGILGNVGSIKLTGSASISAPVAGAFTPDDSIFFLSTVGDNLIHFIDVKSLTDKQQIAPNLPACTPLSSGGADAGCTYTGTGTIVPATAIVIKPRSTT